MTPRMAPARPEKPRCDRSAAACHVSRTIQDLSADYIARVNVSTPNAATMLAR